DRRGSIAPLPADHEGVAASHALDGITERAPEAAALHQIMPCALDGDALRPGDPDLDVALRYVAPRSLHGDALASAHVNHPLGAVGLVAPLRYFDMALVSHLQAVI